MIGAIINLCLLVIGLQVTASLAATNTTSCQNVWKYPQDCQSPNCTYQIAWLYKQPEDAIEFIVSTSHPDRWTGIIFSEEANVSSSDGIFAWVEDNNYVMMDAHLPDYTNAISDKQQSVTNISAQLLRGVATFRFTRKRNTGDEQDVSFADNCPFMIFPVDGGSVDFKRRKVITDEHYPFISDKRICIGPCEPPSPKPATSARPQTRPAATTRPPAAVRPPLVSSTRSARPPLFPTSTTTTTTTSTTQAPTTTTTSQAPKSTTTTTTSTTTTSTTPAPTTQTPTSAAPRTRPPATTTTTSTTTTTTSTTPPPPPPTTTTSTTTTSSTTTTTTTTQPPATSSAPATLAPTSSKPPSLQSTGRSSSSQQPVQPTKWCAGRWSYPPNCRFRPPTPPDVLAYLQAPIDSEFNISPLPIEQSDCTYYAQWQYLDESDSVEFIIQTKTRNRWTGIGFSEGTKMANSDAIIGLIDEQSGRHFVMDTWLRDHVMPEIDQHQNTRQTYGKRENGTTTLRFRRNRLTGDAQDFQFTDSSCAYFFFPTQGGSFNAISKRMHKHESVPIVSEQKICVKSCSGQPTPNLFLTQTISSTTTSSSNNLSTQSSSDSAASATSSSVAPPQTTPSSGPSLVSSEPSADLDGSSTSAPAEKGSSELPAPPSNDLSAELDSSSTLTTSASNSQSVNQSSNPFSRLAFLSEPSLRWLAGIGCVATLLAMIVFQACFTVYKNKQAYKQNLYRQSAFKQNSYLHSAYLADAHQSQPSSHNRQSSSAASDEAQTASLRISAIGKASQQQQRHHHHHHSQQQQPSGAAAAAATVAPQGTRPRVAHQQQVHAARALAHSQHRMQPQQMVAASHYLAGQYAGQARPPQAMAAAYDNFITPSPSETSEELDEEDEDDLEEYDDESIDDFGDHIHRPMQHSAQHHAALPPQQHGRHLHVHNGQHQHARHYHNQQHLHQVGRHNHSQQPLVADRLHAQHLARHLPQHSHRGHYHNHHHHYQH